MNIYLVEIHDHNLNRYFADSAWQSKKNADFRARNLTDRFEHDNLNMYAVVQKTEVRDWNGVV